MHCLRGWDGGGGCRRRQRSGDRVGAVDDRLLNRSDGSHDRDRVGAVDDRLLNRSHGSHDRDGVRCRIVGRFAVAYRFGVIDGSQSGSLCVRDFGVTGDFRIGGSLVGAFAGFLGGL